MQTNVIFYSMSTQTASFKPSFDGGQKTVSVQCYPPPMNAYYFWPSFAIAMDKDTLARVTVYQVFCICLVFCRDLTSESVGNMRATTLSYISLLIPTGQLYLGWRDGLGGVSWVSSWPLPVWLTSLFAWLPTLSTLIIHSGTRAKRWAGLRTQWAYSKSDLH